MNIPRSIALIAAAILVVLAIPPAPADAAWTWYGADYGNWQFRRNADGTGDPIMTQQEDCRKCVASATQAWVDYVRLTTGNFGYGRANGYTQNFYWDT